MTKHLLLTIFAAAIAVSCVFFAVSRSPKPEKRAPQVAAEADMIQGCRELATQLNMQLLSDGSLVESGSGFLYVSGETQCTFDSSGLIQTIVAHDRMSEAGTHEPLITTDEDARASAQSAIAATELPFGEPLLLYHPSPWRESDVIAEVTYEPIQNGYATHGFAGRTSVVLNRYTGEVAAVQMTKVRNCDPPHVQISESQALSISDEVWRGAASYSNAAVHRTNLAYYFSSGSNVTAAGKRYFDDDRVRLCWIISYYFEPRQVGTTRFEGSSLTDIAVDAETGEVLTSPIH